jgi:hypothetical protein
VKNTLNLKETGKDLAKKISRLQQASFVAQSSLASNKES